MINWEFTVISDVNGDTKYAKRKLWMNTVLHETTMFNIKGLLRAVGLFTDEELEGELDFEPEDVLNIEILAVVAQRPYNGDMTNDIKRVRALSSDDREEAASLLP